MINLLKKLLFIKFLCFFSLPLLAFSSSAFLISQSAYKNHDYPNALGDYNNEINKFTNNILLDKLISAVIIEDLDLAEKIASDILSKENNNQEAYIVKLVYLYLNKKFNEIEKVHKNFKSTNNLIDFIFFNGEKLKEKETISKALIDIVISSFSNVEELSLNYNFLLFYTSLANMISNNNDRAILIKAELFQNLGQVESAMNTYEKISIESEYYLDAQRSLAINYSNFYNFSEASKNIQILIDKNNNNYSLIKVQADFYRINKKYDLAISIYNNMINQNKDDLWNIHYMRGICYERLDNWNKAEKDFLISLELKPNSPNVLNYLAYGWVERDIRLNQSLNMLEKAYEENPDSFYIIDSLAWAHFKKNNLDEAARLMEKVIDLAPGEAISLDHLGDIYYAMNRKREAIHFWKQALELADPEDEIEKNVQSKLDNFDAG